MSERFLGLTNALYKQAAHLSELGTYAKTLLKLVYLNMSTPTNAVLESTENQVSCAKY